MSPTSAMSPTSVPNIPDITTNPAFSVCLIG